MCPATSDSLSSSSTSPTPFTKAPDDSSDVKSNSGAADGVATTLLIFLTPAVCCSLEADTCELGPVGHQATRSVPDETRLVDPSGVDELRTLQHAHRSGHRDGPHVDGQFQGRHPTGKLDIERGRRERVDREQQRGRVEGLGPGEGEPSAELPPSARTAGDETPRVG